LSGETERIIPVGASAGKPAHYGAYRRADGKSEWEFAPARWTADGVTIRSRTSGEHVAVEYSPTFTDVEKDKWYYENVTVAASKRLVLGMTSDGRTYAPENRVTRAEFATMMARVLSLPAAKAGTKGYGDMKVSDWFHDAVSSARSAGLLDTMAPGDEFRPNQPMLREEMAYVLARAADYAKATTDKKTVLSERFADRSTVSPEYVSSVERVVSLDFMNGMSATAFDGKGSITRAQSATILVRLARLAGYID
jgi:hypothetical protein